MPISGVVITVITAEIEVVLNQLAGLSAVEVHGHDEQGQIVAVLETDSSEEMEALIDRIAKDKNVLNVGLTYLNTEDEAEKMMHGEHLSRPFGFRMPD